MASTIGFKTVQDYLSGLASLGVIGSSPHKAFWKTKLVGGVATPVTYADFINGFVPFVKYRGSAIPLIWKETPILSPIFLILVESSGYAGFQQMISGGPHLNDPGLLISLPDGTQISGDQVIKDLELWLKNGYPEQPSPVP